jgi:hypothetical protein
MKVVGSFEVLVHSPKIAQRIIEKITTPIHIGNLKSYTIQNVAQ